MGHLIFDLHIDREEYLRWYQGTARAVSAVARDGRRVRFPARSLQRFVQHDGVHGTFVLYFDGDNRLQGMERLE